MLRRSLFVVGLVSFSLVGAPLYAKPAQQAATATKVGKYKADGKEFAQVEAAIYHHAGKQGGVLAFMTQMADHGYVQTAKGKVTLAQFKDIWKDKADSNWVEGKFRGADLGKHEWIPSNYIPKVIDRARTSREGDKWITLQNKMRSPTSLILFKPSKWDVVKKDGKSVLIPQGHSGAAFDKNTGFELTEHQAEFHDELRKVFDSSKTISGVVDGIKGVVSKWVWNGEPLKYPIAKNVVTHDKKPLGPNARAQKVQRDHYDDIMEMLNNIQKTITAKPPATAAKPPAA